jgi:flagellar biosynthesis/type III secretory pathway protein FliH
MILSKSPEFTPWIIPEKSTSQFTPRVVSDNDSMKGFKKWNPLAQNDEAVRLVADSYAEEQKFSKREEEQQSEEKLSSEKSEAEQKSSAERALEVSEAASNAENEDSLLIDPDLLPTFTPVEFRAQGEAEYLRGYNACKENESLEFDDRLNQLESLIGNLREQNVDLTGFYDPVRELVASAIETIMATGLSESQESIAKIVSSLLEEMEAESNGEVRVFLHPVDAALLKNHSFDSESPIKILSDPRLTRGSVRATMGESIVENMIENRVQHVVEQVLAEGSKRVKKPARVIRQKNTAASAKIVKEKNSPKKKVTKK